MIGRQGGKRGGQERSDKGCRNSHNKLIGNSSDDVHSGGMDVGDGTSGASADVPGRRSRTGVGLILMSKIIEEEVIGIKN